MKGKETGVTCMEYDDEKIDKIKENLYFINIYFY